MAWVPRLLAVGEAIARWPVSGPTVELSSASITYHCLSADYFSHVTLSLSPGLLLKKHEPFQLTCDAQVSERESQKPANSSRRAQTTYTFYRNGQPFISSSARSMVTVSQVLRCHSGRYSCTATSGRAQRSSPELHVTTDGRLHSTVHVTRTVSTHHTTPQHTSPGQSVHTTAQSPG